YYEADNKIKEEEKEKIEVKKKTPEKRSEPSDSGIVVNGADNLLIRRATCCNPVPGDPIIGYISKGKGITVHRTDCTNIANLREEDRARLITVNWDTPDSNRKYYVDLQVVSEERKGIFKDISKVCDDYDIEVVGLNLTPGEPGTTNTLITIEITDMHQMQRLLTALRQVEGVIRVFRPR
ncbi:MAG: bifunctional (p)ppGpp synthetase/guanosine-3',5'-bis(diphosphate) 3'-pyrophosphohydrolase, partial [Mogibacterium sp.]|nr:bifunctional (p)ppGpp synthetase/guanosine-3',5'-bis(diphosphate) 3'-pyrophosphohydrolase [Mogibacterium sp.]